MGCVFSRIWETAPSCGRSKVTSARVAYVILSGPFNLNLPISFLHGFRWGRQNSCRLTSELCSSRTIPTTPLVNPPACWRGFPVDAGLYRLQASQGPFSFPSFFGTPLLKRFFYFPATFCEGISSVLLWTRVQSSVPVLSCSQHKYAALLCRERAAARLPSWALHIEMRRHPNIYFQIIFGVRMKTAKRAANDWQEVGFFGFFGIFASCEVKFQTVLRHSSKMDQANVSYPDTEFSTHTKRNPGESVSNLHVSLSLFHPVWVSELNCSGDEGETSSLAETFDPEDEPKEPLGKWFLKWEPNHSFINAIVRQRSLEKIVHKRSLSLIYKVCVKCLCKC